MVFSSRGDLLLGQFRYDPSPLNGHGLIGGEAFQVARDGLQKLDS
jgi:hypothetical protein